MQGEKLKSGNYTLVVESEYFAESPPLNINFTIISNDIETNENEPNLAVIISCSIVSVVVITTVVGYFYRRKKTNKSKFFLFTWLLY